MTDDELRALVRDAIAKHLGWGTERSACGRGIDARVARARELRQVPAPARRRRGRAVPDRADRLL